MAEVCALLSVHISVLDIYPNDLASLASLSICCRRKQHFVALCCFLSFSLVYYLLTITETPEKAEETLFPGVSLNDLLYFKQIGVIAAVLLDNDSGDALGLLSFLSVLAQTFSRGH